LCRAIFWDASRPEKTFSGIVNSDGQHIEFNTAAELVNPESLLLNSDQGRVPDIVHGFTTQGPCTLVGLHELSAPGLADFPNNRAVRTHKYRVSACVVGCYLESDTSPVLSSATLSYSGVDEWLPGIGTISVTEQGASVSFPAQLPTVLDMCVLANRTRISIKIASNFQYSPGGRRYRCRRSSEDVVF
jgi:hypothetical protein